MSQHEIEVAERQLDRVLQFAARIESKVSVLFATNVGITAIMLINLDYKDVRTWYISGPLVAALIMISQSLYQLYHATYPNTSGGSASYVYFAEVAKRTEQNYIKERQALSRQDLYCDLLGQIWRNSQIMNEKFESVKKAYSWTTLSLLPWIMFLAASSVEHSRAILVN